MLPYFIRKYPISLTLLAIVIYLSFARPYNTEQLWFQHADKIAHFLMYAGISSILWLEFFINHRKKPTLPIRRAIVGAIICPILFSGLIEIAQSNLTKYRDGEWADFLANTSGVLVGSLAAWIILRKLFHRR